MYKLGFCLVLLVVLAVFSLAIKVKSTDREVSSPIIIGSPILVSAN